MKTTDNSTAKGIINKTVNLKRSKAFDLHCWWLLDPNKTIFKVKSQVVSMQGCVVKILKAAHGQTGPKTNNYLDSWPTNNCTSTTLLELAHGFQPETSKDNKSKHPQVC